MAVKTLAEVMGMTLGERLVYLRSMTPEEIAESEAPWRAEWAAARAAMRPPPSDTRARAMARQQELAGDYPWTLA